MELRFMVTIGLVKFNLIYGWELRETFHVNTLQQEQRKVSLLFFLNPSQGLAKPKCRLHVQK